jgi:hypothetical protein
MKVILRGHYSWARLEADFRTIWQSELLMSIETVKQLKASKKLST